MKFFQSFEHIIDNELTNIISTQLVLFADNMVFLIQLGAPILILYYGYSIIVIAKVKGTTKLHEKGTREFGVT